MTDPEPSSASACDDFERDAAREAVLKKAELLEWAYERQEARRRAEHEATLPKPEPDRTSRRREVSHQGAEMTRQWQHYIRQQIDAQQRATLKAIAQVVIEEERARQALAERVTALEAEIAELRNRLDQERGARGLRAVPSTPAAPGIMIA